MIDKSLLQSLSSKLAELAPAADNVRQELEKQFYQQLQNSLGKLNLVTREEFDAQLKVLQRAEENIAELEAKIAELETRSQQS
ncbi:MAG: hypothetical protein CMP91_09315 [Gammaproteobacteria bacterium]|nr:hypothetical protein [Gammaproteobacteria bacterium]MAY02571.1 hypothetical protein [Gammaproteobacteria bacterium]|tara:strand:+ start:1671 stop:1919 length:249 start_codon:yes stop_codon:yes gene_type:complete